MINYSITRRITVAEFADILRRSTLGERRPVQDYARLEMMLAHGNLLVTAWAGDLLVGVSRSLTDFAFCCYLSDFAVDEEFQRRGVGLELMRQTQAAVHPECKIILLAAPKAEGYYPRIGMKAHKSAWWVEASSLLASAPQVQ